jgi:SpoIID/LytB domain protein
VRSRAWDLCDTTPCQVFRGTGLYAPDGTLLEPYEHPRSDTAIAATAGTVLTWTSAGTTSITFTEFSAANGGMTAAVSVPYQVAKPDPYDGCIPSSAHAWTRDVAVSRIESAYPSVGSYRSNEVLARVGLGEWGGRVTSVRISGRRGTVTVTGEALRFALGLRSTWFRSGVTAHPVTWTGTEPPTLGRSRRRDAFGCTPAGVRVRPPGSVTAS